MKDPHITQEEFLAQMDQFADLPYEEAFLKNLHFVRACPECTRRILRAFELESLDELAAHPDPISMLLRRDRDLKGAALVSWLESLTAEQRLAAIEREPSLKTQIVLHGLLRRAREQWAQSPKHALAWVELALALVPKLTKTKEDLDEKWELPALVWAYRGNVFRVLSDLHEADRSFRKASSILSRHPCSPEIIAEVLALKASLRRAQRRYPEAQFAIDKAIRLYGEWNRWDLQGQELLTSAKIHCEAGEPEAALAELQRAEPLIDVKQDPRLEWTYAGIRLHLLCETGRFEEARAYTARARELAERHGGPADQLRLRWCEGAIAKALGPPEKAEAAFREVRAGFIELGIGYDTALVSLDIAVLYGEQGRTAEIRELANEMLALFESRGLETEAVAAALLFCKATARDSVTVEALVELRRWLKIRRAS